MRYIVSMLNTNRDLTEGGIIAPLLSFALPLILGNMLQTLYNAADSIIVGRFIGPEALAAVGSAYSLMNFLASLMIGLSMGSGIVFSYLYGEKNYDRLKHVYEVTGGKSPSKTELDNAKMELDTAKADILVKEASIIEVETNLNSAKIDLKNSIITSPIDGVVLTRSIDAGQTVAASFSTPELFVIAENLEKMKLVVNVSEADVGKVSENQKVRFTVDTFPDDEFVSTIYRVNKGSTESEDNIVSYETTIYIDNKDLKLRSGMSATADIETDAAENAVLIPVAALFFQPIVEDKSESGKRPAMLQGPPGRRQRAAKEVNTDISKNATIYVLVNGKPELRHIVTGVSDGKNIQVIEGISSEDNIITSMKRRI